jgi:hypothetical protein
MQDETRQLLHNQFTNLRLGRARMLRLNCPLGGMSLNCHLMKRQGTEMGRYMRYMDDCRSHGKIALGYLDTIVCD